MERSRKEEGKKKERGRQRRERERGKKGESRRAGTRKSDTTPTTLDRVKIILAKSPCKEAAELTECIERIDSRHSYYFNSCLTTSKPT